MQLQARIYATTRAGHQPISELLQQALLAKAPILETGAGLYEQQQSDGSFRLAIVGTAIDHCQAVIQSLDLRLVSEGQFDRVAWDSLVTGA